MIVHSDEDCDTEPEITEESDDIVSSISALGTYLQIFLIIYISMQYLVGVVSGRVLCSIQKIIELLGTKCRTAGCNRICHFNYNLLGCCLTIQGLCSNGHAFTWRSSDSQVNKSGSRIFEDNLLVASFILLSGNNFSKVEKMFHFLGVKMLSRTTFHLYHACSFVLELIVSIPQSR